MCALPDTFSFVVLETALLTSSESSSRTSTMKLLSITASMIEVAQYVLHHHRGYACSTTSYMLWWFTRLQRWHKILVLM
jgi:hypothetical protein